MWIFFQNGRKIYDFRCKSDKILDDLALCIMMVFVNTGHYFRLFFGKIMLTVGRKKDNFLFSPVIFVFFMFSQELPFLFF